MANLHLSHKREGQLTTDVQHPIHLHTQLRSPGPQQFASRTEVSLHLFNLPNHSLPSLEHNKTPANALPADWFVVQARLKDKSAEREPACIFTNWQRVIPHKMLLYTLFGSLGPNLLIFVLENLDHHLLVLCFDYFV